MKIYARFFTYLLASILVIPLFMNCDKRKIYEKSVLTDKIISKLEKDTLVISNEALFKPLILGQEKEQSKGFLNIHGVDSIVQTNYWLKIKNDGLIETPKRLKKTVLKYQDDRLVYSATYKDDGDLFESQRYYFDDDGLQLARHETNSALNLVEEILIYSRDNMIVGKDHLNGKGKKVAVSLIYYTPSENQSTEIIKWFISETTSKIVRQYDEVGNKTKQLSFEARMNQQISDTTEQVFEYTYNDNGTIKTKRQYNSWGMVLDYSEAFYSSITYTYDDKSNIIGSIETKKDGSIRSKFTTTYEYDSRNNWTEKITYKNGQPESKLVRDIYYSEIR